MNPERDMPEGLAGNVAAEKGKPEASGLGFSIMDRIKSFKCAGKGIAIMVRYEHNAWIHAVITFLVVTMGITLGLNEYEWCMIVLAIVSVWTAEALNTALEFLADVTSPGFHPMVEKAKDVAAGAVLITSVGAIVIGLMTLGPYLLRLLRP